MNAGACSALAKLRAMCEPRALSKDQRLALIALRASLSRTIAAAAEADLIIDEKLKGIMPGLDASGIFLALMRVDGLLADDRRARGLQ